MTVAGRKILRGESLMTGDYTAPPTAILKEGAELAQDQFSIEPRQVDPLHRAQHEVKPFDDINVRKAVSAGPTVMPCASRAAVRAVGAIPTHFIPPECPASRRPAGWRASGSTSCKSPNGDGAGGGVHEEGRLRERQVRRPAAC